MSHSSLVTLCEAILYLGALGTLVTLVGRQGDWALCLAILCGAALIARCVLAVAGAIANRP